MAAAKHSLAALTSATRAFGTTNMPEQGPPDSGYISAGSTKTRHPMDVGTGEESHLDPSLGAKGLMRTSSQWL